MGKDKKKDKKKEKKKDKKEDKKKKDKKANVQRMSSWLYKDPDDSSSSSGYPEAPVKKPEPEPVPLKSPEKKEPEKKEPEDAAKPAPDDKDKAKKEKKEKKKEKRKVELSFGDEEEAEEEVVVKKMRNPNAPKTEQEIAEEAMRQFTAAREAAKDVKQKLHLHVIGMDRLWAEPSGDEYMDYTVTLGNTVADVLKLVETSEYCDGLMLPLSERCVDKMLLVVGRWIIPHHMQLYDIHVRKYKEGPLMFDLDNDHIYVTRLAAHEYSGHRYPQNFWKELIPHKTYSVPTSAGMKADDLLNSNTRDLDAVGGFMA